MKINIRKAVAFDGTGKITVIEEAIPKPKAGQVQIKVEASLISPGTELNSVVMARKKATDAGPQVFGYSNAGVVTACGAGCKNLPVGTRVACMGGDGNSGAQHATHACIPFNMAVPIPDGLDFPEATFACLAATSLHAMRRAKIELGEFVGVVGLGLIGQLAAQWSRLGGCHVMGIDRLPMRLEKAVQCGLECAVNGSGEDPLKISETFTRGYGLDTGVIAFGGDGTPALELLYKMLKTAPDTHKYGSIVMVGGATITHQFAAALGNVDVLSAARTGPGYHDKAWESGADYPSVFVPWTTRRNLETSVRFMAADSLKVRPLITHEVSIDEAPEACERLIATPNEALGVVFRMT